MDKVLFGERLKNARLASGMTQKQMSSRIGVKENTIAEWETGKQQPRANRVQMIASLLNVPLLWLLAGSQQVPDSTSNDVDSQMLQHKIAEVHARMNALRSSLDEFNQMVQNHG